MKEIKFNEAKELDVVCGGGVVNDLVGNVANTFNDITARLDSENKIINNALKNINGLVDALL